VGCGTDNSDHTEVYDGKDDNVLSDGYSDSSSMDYPDSSFDDILDDGGIDRDSPSSDLCNYCRNIFQNWSLVLEHHSMDNDLLDLEFPHYPDPISVEASAKAGCSLCNLFCADWSDLCGNWGDNPRETERRWIKSAGDIKTSSRLLNGVVLVGDTKYTTSAKIGDSWTLNIHFRVQELAMHSMPPSPGTITTSSVLMIPASGTCMMASYNQREINAYSKSQVTKVKPV